MSVMERTWEGFKSRSHRSVMERTWEGCKSGSCRSASGRSRSRKVGGRQVDGQSLSVDWLFDFDSNCHFDIRATAGAAGGKDRAFN